VGTFRGVLRLKILIRTSPFLSGLSNKKAEGDAKKGATEEERSEPLYNMRKHSRSGENGSEVWLALIIF